MYDDYMLFLKRSHIFVKWIGFAIITSVIPVLVYSASQQILRQNANDPQIQLSEDAAARLSQGDSVNLVSGQTQTIDIAKSLSVFAMIINEEGQTVFSTARLQNSIPTLPSGVLAKTKNDGQIRFTWQPRDGVRSAVVITYYTGSHGSGYVLVGRSLREVEKREDSLLSEIILGWIVYLFATLILATLGYFYMPSKPKRK